MHSDANTSAVELNFSAVGVTLVCFLGGFLDFFLIFFGGGLLFGSALLVVFDTLVNT